MWRKRACGVREAANEKGRLRNLHADGTATGGSGSGSRAPGARMRVTQSLLLLLPCSPPGLRAVRRLFRNQTGLTAAPDRGGLECSRVL